MRILTGILLLFLAGSEPVFTQTKAGIDSFSQILSREREYELRQQLSASREDSNRVLILHELYYTILFSEPDSAMYLAQEGLKLSLQLNYKKGETLCKTDIGGVWWIVGDYLKANEIMLEGLKIAESINDPLAIEWSLAFLLSNNRDQGNTTEALKYAIKGWARHEFFSEKFWNVIIASVYQEMNKTDSALFYLQRGDSGDYNFLMFGHVYTKMGKYDLARFYYKSAVAGHTKHNNLKDLADNYIGLARLYEKEGKPDSAIYYASKGFTIAQTASFKKWVYETSLILSRIYEKKDVYQSLQYFKLAMAAKDSMFNLQKVTESLSNRYYEQLHQKEAEAARINYQNRIRTYLLVVAVAFFLILATILYRSSRHKQKAKEKIEKSYGDLKDAQAQLIQSEKMASLGELTAGIAHEIQNPLNFVNNFSEVNSELLAEMNQEIDKGNFEEVKSIAKDVSENEQKIIFHGKRADAIVKGMLQHSRKSSGIKEPTNINALADEYLRLAYHGLRAKDKSFNATIKTDFDEEVKNANVISQDIGRVFLNLITNAFYAVTEKKKQNGGNYEPTVTVGTKRLNGKVQITVRDNGNGIPQHVLDKIFQPFFTTKPTGEGTGLGLSMSYDIITKAHSGELQVKTKDGEFAEFIISLPQ